MASKKKFGKRRFSIKKRIYKGRKGFKRRSGKQKASFAKKVVQTLGGDQVLSLPFVDNIKITNTTNAIANMVVWGENNLAGPEGLATTSIRNLCIDDRYALGLMFSGMQQQIGYSADGPTQSTTAKLVRKSAEVTARIVNAQTSAVCVWEYRCMARRDQTSSVVSILSNQSVTAQGTNRQKVAAPISSVPYPTALGGALNECVIGTTPYMWHDFLTRFKIKKVKKRELAPGKVWRITYRQKKPRIFDWNNLTSTPTVQPTESTTTPGTGMYIIRKGQTFSLFMAQGTWATDSAASANFQVGISNVNLGVEYTHKYHYGYMIINSQSANNFNQVPGFSTDAANVPLPLTSVNPIRTITAGTGAVTYPNNNPMGAAATLDADQMDV